LVGELADESLRALMPATAGSVHFVSLKLAIPSRSASMPGVWACRRGVLSRRDHGCRSDRSCRINEFDPLIARLDMPVAGVIRFSFPLPMYRGMRLTR
jgi:hypothetical protein